MDSPRILVWPEEVELPELPLPLDWPAAPDLQLACLVGALDPLEASGLEALRLRSLETAQPVSVPQALRPAAQRLRLLMSAPETLH